MLSRCTHHQIADILYLLEPRCALWHTYAYLHTGSCGKDEVVRDFSDACETRLIPESCCPKSPAPAGRVFLGVPDTKSSMPMDLSETELTWSQAKREAKQRLQVSKLSLPPACPPCLPLSLPLPLPILIQFLFPFPLLYPFSLSPFPIPLLSLSIPPSLLPFLPPTVL